MSTQIDSSATFPYSGATLRRARWQPALLLLLAGPALLAPAQIPQKAPAQTGAPPASTPSTDSRVPLDRIVAIVNNDLILQSDLDEDERFQAFEPFRAETSETRKQILDRLIDRTLIQQQMALQPQTGISDKSVDDELVALRKNIPACASYHCDTNAGWQKFCADHGFTPEEVHDRWRQRMQVLQFIEQRFRMGIRIDPSEIDTYYKTKLVPAYQKQNVAPPPENAISDRIQEILLQQQVSGLLDDWLKALRAEGSVQVLVPEDNTDQPVPPQP